MSDWMECVGQNNYTIPQFRAEAERYGVTRRVPLSILKIMSWGEMALCVQQEPNIIAFSAFLEYPIQMLSGVSPAAQAALAEHYVIEMASPAPEEPEVERECGSYEQGAMYTIRNATLAEVARFLEGLKKEGVDIGKPMIGCMPDHVAFIDEPYPRIRNLEFFRGFRSYNKEKFWTEVREEQEKIDSGHYRDNRKNPVVSGGTYYKQHAVDETRDEGSVQVVEKYNSRNKKKEATEQKKLDREMRKQSEMQKKRQVFEIKLERYARSKGEVRRYEILEQKRRETVERRVAEVKKISSKLQSALLRKQKSEEMLLDTQQRLRAANERAVELAPKDSSQPELI